jgi:hypothetical protein
MTFVNEILQASSALLPLILTIAGMFDPISTLYGMLAGTYGSAAIAAGAGDHRLLCRCYVASAALHGLIGLSHSLHI